MRRNYKASGALGDGNVVALVAAAVVVGGIVGGLEGLVAHWFSLFLVFPALIGGAAGMAVDRSVASKNIRAPGLAFVAGFLGGLAGQAAMHGASYEVFRMQASKDIAEDAAADGDAPAVSASDLLDSALLEKTGHAGFLGFLAVQAETGVKVSHHGNDGINFTGVGFWGLFAAEFLLAAVVGGWIGRARAQQPFCENCRRWYDAAEVVAIGGGDKSVVATVQAALEREAWSEAVSALGTPDEKTFSALTVRRCQQCELSDPQLFLHRTINAKKKPQTKEHWSSLVRSDELKTIKSLLPAKEDKAPSAS